MEMTEHTTSLKYKLTHQALDAREVARELRRYGSHAELLACPRLGPQYADAFAQYRAAGKGLVWADLSSAERDRLVRETRDGLRRAARAAARDWIGEAKTTVHDALTLFFVVVGALAWLFGSFVMPLTFALAWTRDVSSATLRVLLVMLGVAVLGIAYNIAMVTFSLAMDMALEKWRGRK